MKIDYGTQISFSPIPLSIGGNIRKPLLSEISELSFEKFNHYESFLKLTPEIFYTKLNEENGKEYWEKLSDEEKSSLELFDIIKDNVDLQNLYLEILNFFFLEKIFFYDGCFVIIDSDESDNPDYICGIISRESFPGVIDFIQQICCIKDEEPEPVKFKNKLAKKLYDMMQKAKREENKRNDINLTLPNIISSLANMHPSLNYVNIWGLTLFQLLDSFNRTQVNVLYSISSTRVSIWGDEKKTFDEKNWFKNIYDKRS